MEVLRVNETEAQAALRALVTVAHADDVLEHRERAMLEGIAPIASQLSLEDAKPITPDELAKAVTDPSHRRGILQRMILLATLDEKIADEELTVLRGFAEALGVEEPALEQVELCVKGHHRRLALHVLRTGFIGRQIKDAWQEEGVRGFFKVARAMRGKEEPVMRDRYRGLGDLPEGTLGRRFFDHCRDNGLSLPGEKKGMPELVLFHDVGHALTGFGTSPTEEVKMAGFEAGYMGSDGFSVAMLAVFLFHFGVELPNTMPARGVFDLDTFDAAYQLGRRSNTDLRSWDPWPSMDKPVGDVCGELGLPSPV